MKWLWGAIFAASCSGAAKSNVDLGLGGLGTDAAISSDGSAIDLQATAGDGAGGDLAVDSTPGTFAQVMSFGTNPGALNMYSYVPTHMPASAPLVVALPGCGQTAANYEDAGWNELADIWKFYVAYAEVPGGGINCLDWVTAANNARDQGQAFSIKQMADYMKATYSVDNHRVFVTGLSAGGAMTSVMLADYPDVFSAGAIMSGMPYQCANFNTLQSLECAATGVVMTAAQWGDAVRAADSSYSGTTPRVSIWHGDTDTLVNATNVGELVKQWTNVNGIDATADATEQVAGATHTSYEDGGGHVLVETYTIPNMGHGTAIAAGFSPANGCGVAAPFILEAGICSTYYAGKFFALDQ